MTRTSTPSSERLILPQPMITSIYDLRFTIYECSIVSVSYSCQGCAGLPGYVERPGRAGQVRRAADAANARRDDQAGLRVLAFEDDLEAAEQRGPRPGVAHIAVLHVDA